MNYVSRLGLAREPFSNSPDPGFLYLSKQHTDCLQQVEIAVRLRRGLNVVLGDIGTGKTTLCRTFLLNMGSDDTSVHLLLDPPSRSQRFFLHVLYGIFTGKEASKRLNEWQLKEGIKKALFRQCVEEGKLVVLIIDEGQKLTKGCLEILRELLNYETNSSKLLQIVIFAQRELETQLERMPNLLDRVNCMQRLQPLDGEDSEAMIRYRVAQASPDPDNPPALFSTAACRAIYRAAEGYPRRMVRLCHKCLIAALVHERSSVNTALVRQVVKQERREGTLKVKSTFGPLARGAAVAGVLAGSVLVAGLMLGPGMQRFFTGDESASVRMEVSRPSGNGSATVRLEGAGVDTAQAPATSEAEQPAEAARTQDQTLRQESASGLAADSEAAAPSVDVSEASGAAEEQISADAPTAGDAGEGANADLATEKSAATLSAAMESAAVESATQDADIQDAGTQYQADEDSDREQAEATPKKAGQTAPGEEAATSSVADAAQEEGAKKQAGEDPDQGLGLLDRLMAFIFPEQQPPAPVDPNRYASDIVQPEPSLVDPDQAEHNPSAEADTAEDSVRDHAPTEDDSSVATAGIPAEGAAAQKASERGDTTQTVTGEDAAVTTSAQADTDASQHSDDGGQSASAMSGKPGTLAAGDAETARTTGEKSSEDMTKSTQSDLRQTSASQEKAAPAPENLGTMKMPRGYSLSSVLRRVYGIYSGELLREFRRANPGVRNVNNIPVGRKLVMPLAGPDEPDGFHRLFWVSLGSQPDLQGAFDSLREYLDTGWPMRLLCSVINGQTVYRVVLSEPAADRQGALGVLGSLPPALQQGAQIIQPSADQHVVGWLDKAARELAEKS